MFEQELKIFLSVVRTKFEVLDEMRSIYSKTLAPDFNALNLFYDSVNENKVSQLIAFFLDPEESHAQGDVFLQIFLRELNAIRKSRGLDGIDFTTDFSVKVEALARPARRSVTTEAPSMAARRIDILLESQDALIGIENKIYDTTDDQPKQVEDYLTYLCERSRGKKNGYCLLYLAPKNKGLPAEHSISADSRERHLKDGTLQLGNYEEHIIPMIRRFVTSCEAERVRAFLGDFESKLKQMYLKAPVMNKNELVVKYAKESPANLGLCIEIGIASEALKKRLGEDLDKQLNDVANEIKIPFGDKTGGAWKNLRFYAGYEHENFCIGLLRTEPDKEPSRLEQVEDLFPGDEFKCWPWWPLHKTLYSNINADAQFWMDIESGKVKEQFRQFAKTIWDKYGDDDL